MTYTVIPDADIDQDSPVTQPLMTALRDNPIAIAAGDAGAPRIVDAALDTTVTAAGTTWVTNRNAGAAVGAVGTYAFLYNANTATPISPGTLVSGSNLRYSDSVNTIGSAPSGTWRCMGNAAVTGGSNANATLYLRIS